MVAPCPPDSSSTQGPCPPPLQLSVHGRPGPGGECTSLPEMERRSALSRCPVRTWGGPLEPRASPEEGAPNGRCERRGAERQGRVGGHCERRACVRVTLRRPEGHCSHAPCPSLHCPPARDTGEPPRGAGLGNAQCVQRKPRPVTPKPGHRASCEGHLSWRSVLLRPRERVWGGGLGQGLQVRQVALKGLGQRGVVLRTEPPAAVDAQLRAPGSENTVTSRSALPTRRGAGEGPGRVARGGPSPRRPH